MITIKTTLADGIYASHGGGQTKVHYEYETVGPLSLLKAIRQLLEHRKHMQDCYGNIGCGSSWIEIDGQKIEQSELEPIIINETDSGYPNPIPCTVKAKYFLEDFYLWKQKEKATA